MSWLKCDNCGDLIHTDSEPEAYNEREDIWQCQFCRNTDFEPLPQPPTDTDLPASTTKTPVTE